MYSLELYRKADASAVYKYFLPKEVLKYTNEGGYKCLAIVKIYKTWFMLLKEDRNIVGCGCIRWKFSRETRRFGWWLYDIWIKPEERGKGKGKILMAMLLEDLRRRGAKRVGLTVSPSNVRALHLYTALGFHTIEKNCSNNKDIVMAYDL